MAGSPGQACLSTGGAARPTRGAGALCEWHCEVAVRGALLTWRLAGEVGDPHAEILRRQRQLLRVDTLRVSPAPKGFVGELPLGRTDLPAGPEVDVRLAVGGLDAPGQLGELRREFFHLSGGERV